MQLDSHSLQVAISRSRRFRDLLVLLAASEHFKSLHLNFCDDFKVTPEDHVRRTTPRNQHVEDLRRVISDSKATTVQGFRADLLDAIARELAPRTIRVHRASEISPNRPTQS